MVIQNGKNMNKEQHNYCLDVIARYNRDFVFMFYFIEEQHQNSFLTMMAFYAELNHILDVVREPMMGHIRLQWWWDGIESIAQGNVSSTNFTSHPVGGLLSNLVIPHNVEIFQTLIQVIEEKLDHPQSESFDKFYALCQRGLGTVFSFVAGDDYKNTGANFEAISLLKQTQIFAKRNRITMPQNYFKEFGEMDNSGIVELKPNSESFISATKAFYDDILSKENPQDLPPKSRMRLFKNLADLYQKQIRTCHYDVFDPRMNARPIFTELKMMLRAIFRIY